MTRDSKLFITLLLLLSGALSLGQTDKNITPIGINKSAVSEIGLEKLDLNSAQVQISQVPEFNSSTEAPSSITRNIIQDRNGNIWLATWEGIIKYDGTHFTNMTKGLSTSRFFSALEDRTGNFWFGSIGEGVYYYNGSSFKNYTVEDGLVDNRVTHIYEDRQGAIWFATVGGLSHYDGEQFRNYTIAEGLPHNDVNYIVEDETGKLWFGTRGHAFHYDGSSFVVLVNKEGSPFRNVRCVLLDRNGFLWLGGEDGLWKYDGADYTNFTKQFVGYIYEDAKGNIWTSSESESRKEWVLSRYAVETLAHDSTTVTEVISEQGMYFGILEDRNNNIWFGSLAGAYRYDGKTFTNFR